MTKNGLITENVDNIWNTTGQDFEHIDWNENNDFVDSDDDDYEDKMKEIAIKQQKVNAYYTKKYQNLTSDTTKLFRLAKAPDHWKEMFNLDALGQPVSNITENNRQRKNYSARTRKTQ